jgi:anti-sigma factor RsiW
MHAIVQNHLEKMLENRLPPQLRQQVEDHLTGCADCREGYAEALETSRLLKLLASDEAPEPAPGFSIKVMQSIQEARASRGWLYFPALRELGFAMAAFLLLLGGYYVTVQATDRTSNSAEMLLDMPAGRSAPVLAAHKHDAHDPAAQLCKQCYQQKQATTQVADDHARRESVMASLAAVEVGD